MICMNSEFLADTTFIGQPGHRHSATWTHQTQILGGKVIPILRCTISRRFFSMLSLWRRLWGCLNKRKWQFWCTGGGVVYIVFDQHPIYIYIWYIWYRVNDDWIEAMLAKNCRWSSPKFHRWNRNTYPRIPALLRQQSTGWRLKVRETEVTRFPKYRLTK